MSIKEESSRLKVKLKSKEALEKEGFVYSVLKHSNQVILTNKKNAWKSFSIEDMDRDQVFIISDKLKVFTREEYEAFKDVFEIVE